MRGYKLGEIAEIRSGYTFRGKIQEQSGGNARILQIRDARKHQEATGNTCIQPHNLPEILWQGRDGAFLEPGNVLLPARGEYRQVFWLPEAAPANQPVIASSQFLIITPGPAVLPEFLCWQLNQPASQKFLQQMAGGTNMPMLSVLGVGLLPLQVPSMETQRHILHLNHLWQREQALASALQKNRETQLQAVFQQLLEEKKP